MNVKEALEIIDYLLLIIGKIKRFLRQGGVFHFTFSILHFTFFTASQIHKS